MKRKKVLLSLVLVAVLSACGKTPAAEETAAEEAAVAEPAVVAEDTNEKAFQPWDCDDALQYTDTDIVLYFEWVAVTEEQSVQFADAIESMVSIDGVPAPIKEVGHGDITINEDGYYQQRHWMNIGELEPGDYNLIAVAQITEQVYDGWDWYGPDNEIDALQGTCHLVIVDEESAMAEIQATDQPVSCSISSPFKEEWSPYLCETFDGSTSLWTGNDQGTSTWVEDGKYVLDNSTKVEYGYKTGFIYPITVGYAQDYMFSVDGFMDSKYRDCTWGIFVRSTSDEIVYFFMISNEGVYSLTGSTDVDANRYLGNIKSGNNGAIVWDGWNNLTAIVEGTSMEFYINGEFIMAHEGNNSTNPELGLIVWGGEGVSAVNYFDNLLVRTSN